MFSPRKGMVPTRWRNGKGPWMGGEINDWFYSDSRYGRYADVLEDMKEEKGWGCFDRMRVTKVTNCGSMQTRTSMSNILTLDYDMDARPLRFVYRDDFRHQSLYPDDLEKLFSKLEVHIPAPFRQGDILWDPSGEPGIPYEEDSTPFVLDYIPNWNEAEQAANGFAPGEKFYQRKGEDGKYESRFQDPPRDYGAYGVTVGKSGQLHQAYNGFACYLDLEPYPRPPGRDFRRPEAHQRIHQGEPDGRLAPQQRAGVAPPAQAGTHPVHLSHHLL